MSEQTPDAHAYQPGPPCRVERLHKDAHVCDVEGCELPPNEHPTDD